MNTDKRRMNRIGGIMKRLSVIVAVFFVGLLMAGWVACGQTNAAPEARAAAADFQLTDLNGKPLSLSSLKGKVVLLDFWATWCPPCRMELPHFKELYAAYKGKGLEMVGLSVGEQADTVKSFAKENNLTYAIALSAPKIEQAYGGIRGIPTTFLIDKQGRIAKKYVGYQEKAVFEQEIKKLLAE
jgi:cytochrome c biogenesis protein CcmG/thiol:disulfide interchange protein DsbE